MQGRKTKRSLHVPTQNLKTFVRGDLKARKQEKPGQARTEANIGDFKAELATKLLWWVIGLPLSKKRFSSGEITEDVNRRILFNQVNFTLQVVVFVPET